jgi:hypothetical protein
MLEQYKNDFDKHHDDSDYENVLCRIAININQHDIHNNPEYMTLCREILLSIPPTWTKLRDILTDLLQPCKIKYDLPIATNSILRNISIMTLADICTVVNNYPDKFSSESCKIILGYYMPSYKTEIHLEYISYIFMGMALSIPKSILSTAKLPTPAKKYYEKLYATLQAHFTAYNTHIFNLTALMTDVVRALCDRKCNINCTVIKYIKTHLPMCDIYNINKELLTKREKTICEIDIIIGNIQLK